jgi:hypothetical protein
MTQRFILFYEAVEQDGTVRRRAMLPPQRTRAACRRIAFGARSRWMWDYERRPVRNFRIARVSADHPKCGAWIEDPPYPHRSVL